MSTPPLNPADPNSAETSARSTGVTGASYKPKRSDSDASVSTIPLADPKSGHTEAAEIGRSKKDQRVPKSPPGNLRDLDDLVPREATLDYWESLEEETRITCHNTIDQYYHYLLEDFRRNANDAIGSYGTYDRRNKNWRLAMIGMTGGLAFVNVAATSFPDTWPHGKEMRLALGFAAALYAVVLALLTNVESFLHYNEKKSTSRESRELYLDAYREFEMLRLRYVYPYGYHAQACHNFNVLYQRLVTKDLELRRKIMQVSTARTGTGKI